MKTKKEKTSKVGHQPYNIPSQSKASTSQEQDNESNVLCVDIWEHIAKYLNLSDLINLAYVCVDAREASRLVYKRKYKLKGLVICEIEKKTEPEPSEKSKGNLPMLKPPIQLYGDGNIWIENCKESLRFLRNFGQFLSEVIIEPYSSMNDRRLEKIIEYTNKFCTQSRNTIIVRKYLPFLMGNPLKNIYKVVMLNGEYSINEFNSLFPDLQSLHIHFETSGKYMKQRLPSVEELYIDHDEHLWIKETDDSILLAMQLNPQIQKLVNTIDCNHWDPSFKIEVNDRKIKLIDKHERVKDFLQIMQPEKYEEMYADLRWIDSSPNGFIEKFINLKSLTMVWYEENLKMLCKKIPKLQVLRVIYHWSHANNEYGYRRIRIHLASTAIHRKLSTFSIHFEGKNDREQFYINTIQFVDTARWQITLNEDGPKHFRFSIVLNKIQDI